MSFQPTPDFGLSLKGGRRNRAFPVVQDSTGEGKEKKPRTELLISPCFKVSKQPLGPKPPNPKPMKF